MRLVSVFNGGALNNLSLGKVDCRNKKNLLVIEDDPTLRVLWAVFLEKYCVGFNVVLAENGYDALIKVYEVKPDLIITDIDMPKISGRELIRILGGIDEYSKIPIIVVSGSDFSDLLAEPSVISCFAKPAHYYEIIKFFADKFT